MAGLELSLQIVNKLLTALNECTESVCMCYVVDVDLCFVCYVVDVDACFMNTHRWGQVFILDAVASYTPSDAKEAQSVCERVTPRLAHANSAIVLSSVKVSYVDLVYHMLRWCIIC